ncbi:hypothetical protein BDN72DRAFT_197277 [Pluteus cervinus]|uniref:Uncharacterized protein n=1 Tax=Pluteus cervinus TaxID=181527 RepID=A0ACD3AIQ6_9AGAR|nr:hypothetical protein BDN72DRAFT_197277 [Pluteus cervinus]
MPLFVGVDGSHNPAALRPQEFGGRLSNTLLSTTLRVFIMPFTVCSILLILYLIDKLMSISIASPSTPTRRTTQDNPQGQHQLFPL